MKWRKEEPLLEELFVDTVEVSMEERYGTPTMKNLEELFGDAIREYVVKAEKSCENKHIDDRVLYQAFINTFNAMIQNRNYFMEKWKEYLKSDNLLQRYKAKQFMRIIKNAESIEELDIDLFFRIIEKMTVFEGEKKTVTLLDETEVEIVIE